jgi:hypothetical protein
MRAQIRSSVGRRRIKLVPHIHQLGLGLPSCENDLGHFAAESGIAKLKFNSLELEVLNFLAALCVDELLRNIFGGWLFLWDGFAEPHHLFDQPEGEFVYF